MNDTVIVTGGTKNHVAPMAVLAMNIRDVCPKLADKLIIFHDGIPLKQQKLINSIFPSEFRKYSFDVPKSAYRSNTSLRYFTHMCFSKFECLNLLQEYNRIIWTDYDVVINSNLEELKSRDNTGLQLIKWGKLKDKLQPWAPIEIKKEYDLDGYAVCTPLMVMSRDIGDHNLFYRWCCEHAVEYASFINMPEECIFSMLVQKFNIRIHELPKDRYALQYAPNAKTASIYHAIGREKFWNGLYNENWERRYKEWLALGGAKYRKTTKEYMMQIFYNVQNRLKWCGSIFRWLGLRCINGVTGRLPVPKDRYGKLELHSNSDGNIKISELLRADKAFAFCRCSYTEMDVMVKAQTEEYFHIPVTKLAKRADVYHREGESKSKGLLRYNDLMRNAFRSADIVGVWRDLTMGDALINAQHDPGHMFLAEATCSEPYLFDIPWSRYLSGKRVLVVSPFYKEISEQYKVREKIWDNLEVLPEFSLDTEPSIWYYDGNRDSRFADWFEAYDYLCSKVMEHEFDVALLGCGYFGFPLASYIKTKGKQAIHMGGATQLLFGIYGKRWENNETIMKHVNEYWIRPDAVNKPKDDKYLDNGCYW